MASSTTPYLSKSVWMNNAIQFYIQVINEQYNNEKYSMLTVQFYVVSR